MIIISSPEVQLLTITKADFKKVITELYKLANQKVKTFSGWFPSMTEHGIKKISHYFTEKNYGKGEIGYSQNESAKGLYFLKEGENRILKIETSPSQSWIGQSLSPLTSSKYPKKTELPIVGILKGQFFGEELLLDKSKREYTALSNNQDCHVYLLDFFLYEKLNTEFPDLIDILREQAFERFVWRRERASSFSVQKVKFSVKPLVGVSSVSGFKRPNTSFTSSLTKQRIETLNIPIKDMTVESDLGLESNDSDYYRPKIFNHPSLQEKSIKIAKESSGRIRLKSSNSNSILGFVNITNKNDEQNSLIPKNYLSLLRTFEKCSGNGVIGKPRIKTLFRAAFTSSESLSPIRQTRDI